MAYVKWLRIRPVELCFLQVGKQGFEVAWEAGNSFAWKFDTIIPKPKSDRGIVQ